MLAQHSAVILLCLVFVTRIVNSVYAPITVKNLAFGKKTKQSSKGQGESDNAVNGFYRDMAQTSAESFNWWSVDLDRPFTIVVIRVHPPSSCCQEHLAKLSIMTSEVTRPSPPQPKSHDWTQKVYKEETIQRVLRKTFSPAVQAQHVALTTLQARPLSVAEVEIFGNLETPNVAFDKAVTHSSPYADFPASNANNGNLDDYWKGSARQWLKVDLGEPHSVISILAHHGKGCCESDLTNIHILTSELSSPPRQPVSRRGWVSRGQGQRPHKVALIIVFKEAKTVRFVAVVVPNGARPLALAELQVYGIPSVAFNKPTSQSSTQTSYYPNLAVNGYLEDYSLTHNTQLKWWTVNLLDIYRLFKIIIVNRQNSEYRGQEVNLLTTKTGSRGNLPVNFNKWLPRHSVARFENVVHHFIPIGPIDAQQILLKSSHRRQISLAEVVVYEANMALEQQASQSSFLPYNRDQFQAQHAVDGNYSTLTATDFYIHDHSKQWFRLTFQKAIVIRFTAIYFPTELCRRPQGQSVICAQLLTSLQMWTSIRNLPTVDTLRTNVGWTICYQQDELPPNILLVECNQNYRFPYAKNLLMQPAQKNRQIYLAEVQVYGYAPPQLDESTSSADSRSNPAYSVKVSFNAWTTDDPGSIPPDFYIVGAAGFNSTAKVRHTDNKLGKVTALLNNLPSKETVKYTIICEISGHRCPGKGISGAAVSGSCSAPDVPTFKIEKSLSTDEDGWTIAGMLITINDTQHNCRYTSRYWVRIHDLKGFILLNTQVEYNQIQVNDVTDGETYNVIITLENDLGWKGKSARGRWKLSSGIKGFCAFPPHIKNSKLLNSSRTSFPYSEKAAYVCDQWRKKTGGSEYLTCLQKGSQLQWRGDKIECELSGSSVFLIILFVITLLVLSALLTAKYFHHRQAKDQPIGFKEYLIHRLQALNTCLVRLRNPRATTEIDKGFDEQFRTYNDEKFGRFQNMKDKPVPFEAHSLPNERIEDVNCPSFNTPVGRFSNQEEGQMRSQMPTANKQFLEIQQFFSTILRRISQSATSAFLFLSKKLGYQDDRRKPKTHATNVVEPSLMTRKSMATHVQIIDEEEEAFQLPPYNQPTMSQMRPFYPHNQINSDGNLFTTAGRTSISTFPSNQKRKETLFTQQNKLGKNLDIDKFLINQSTERQSALEVTPPSKATSDHLFGGLFETTSIYRPNLMKGPAFTSNYQGNLATIMAGKSATNEASCGFKTELPETMIQKKVGEAFPAKRIADNTGMYSIPSGKRRESVVSALSQKMPDAPPVIAAHGKTSKNAISMISVLSQKLASAVPTTKKYGKTSKNIIYSKNLSRNEVNTSSEILGVSLSTTSTASKKGIIAVGDKQEKEAANATTPLKSPGALLAKSNMNTSYGMQDGQFGNFSTPLKAAKTFPAPMAASEGGMKATHDWQREQLGGAPSPQRAADLLVAATTATQSGMRTTYSGYGKGFGIAPTLQEAANVPQAITTAGQSGMRTTYSRYGKGLGVASTPQKSANAPLTAGGGQSGTNQDYGGLERELATASMAQRKPNTNLANISHMNVMYSSYGRQPAVMPTPLQRDNVNLASPYVQGPVMTSAQPLANYDATSKAITNQSDANRNNAH